jgi:hypothetical protein
MTAVRSARYASVLVWLVWAVFTAIAVAYVARYGSKVLFQDDLTLMYVWGHDARQVARDLWVQHNEHRIPLPHLVHWTLYAIQHDVRHACWFSVALMSAIAAAMIVAARRWRGSTSVFDVLFPLVWLHLGFAENWLMGFQLALMLPTALVCAVLLISIGRAREMSPRDAAISAACLAGLPLCGGPGMLQAPLLALWLGVVGWNHVRSKAARTKRAGRILLAGVALTGLVGALYVLDFHYPPGSHRGAHPSTIVGIALRVLALALGPAGEAWWPWSGVCVVACAVSAAFLAVRAWRSRAEDRWRAAAVIVGLTSSAILSIGIGYGRGDIEGSVNQGFAFRYVGLSAPILCTAYFGWLLFGSRIGSRFVSAVLVIVCAGANVWINVPFGLDYGRQRHSIAVAFERDVARGVRVPELVHRYAEYLDNDEVRFERELRQAQRDGLPPFDRYPQWAKEREKWPMFALAPREVEAEVPPSARFLGGRDPALMTTGGTRLTFDVVPGAVRFVGSFGVFDGVWNTPACPKVRVVVVEVGKDGRCGMRYERWLDPRLVEADRGPQRFVVEVEPWARRSVQVVVCKGDFGEVGMPWVWIRGVGFE